MRIAVVQIVRGKGTLIAKVVVLSALAALPLSASQGRGGLPPPPPPPSVTLVNPTAADCYSGAGCLDPAFGNSGKVLQDVGGSPQYGYAVAVQPDGKVVAVGASMYQSNPNAWDWVIARFNADGTLDSTFGTSVGVTKLHFFDTPPAQPSLEQARAVAVQSDGKIVVAGWGSRSGTKYTAVVRLTASGAVDVTFGSGGTAMVNALTGTLTGMSIQPDGKIVLLSNSSPNTLYFTVARLNSNGSVDTGFGSNGSRTILSGGSFAIGGSLALQSDGKIVIGGGNGSDFGLTRLTSKGAWDTSFGTKGLATVDFFGQVDTAQGIAVAADNSIVAVGYAQTTSASSSANMAIARFTANGVLASAFGTSGRVVLDMHGGRDAASELRIQSDGKIVFVGRAQLPDLSNEFVIVGRLTSTGALDSLFGTGGITETAFTVNDRSTALVLGPNGTINTVGYAYTSPPTTNPNTWLLARYFQ